MLNVFDGWFWSWFGDTGFPVTCQVTKIPGEGIVGEAQDEPARWFRRGEEEQHVNGENADG
jgi:hypothetical protein